MINIFIALLLITSSAVKAAEATSIATDPEEAFRKLRYCVYQGDLQAIRTLLAAKADPNGRTFDKNYHSHLSTAIDRNDVPMVILLLSNRADVNDFMNHQKDSIYHVTPLYHATCAQNETIMRLLLVAKADVDKRNTQFDLTPLMQAAEHNRSALCSLLLDARADVHAITTLGVYSQQFCGSFHGDVRQRVKLMHEPHTAALLLQLFDKHEAQLKLEKSDKKESPTAEESAAAAGAGAGKE